MISYVIHFIIDSKLHIIMSHMVFIISHDMVVIKLLLTSTLLIMYCHLNKLVVIESNGSFVPLVIAILTRKNKLKVCNYKVSSK